MSVFLMAFMAMLGAMGAVAVAPILLGLTVLASKGALILGLAFAARWAFRMVLRRNAE
jgi:hypothetical protein